MMENGRFSEEQIIGILKQHEVGRKVADLPREHAIESKYGGLGRDAFDAPSQPGTPNASSRCMESRPTYDSTQANAARQVIESRFGRLQMSAQPCR